MEVFPEIGFILPKGRVGFLDILDFSSNCFFINIEEFKARRILLKLWSFVKSTPFYGWDSFIFILNSFETFLHFLLIFIKDNRLIHWIFSQIFEYFSKVAISKNKLWSIEEFGADFLLITEDNNFGFKLHLVDVLRYNKSFLIITDNVGTDEFFVLNEFGYVSVPNVFDIVVFKLLLNLVKFLTWIVLIDNINTFSDVLFDPVAVFDFFDDFSHILNFSLKILGYPYKFSPISTVIFKKIFS